MIIFIWIFTTKIDRFSNPFLFPIKMTTIIDVSYNANNNGSDIMITFNFFSRKLSKVFFVISGIDSRKTTAFFFFQQNAGQKNIINFKSHSSFCRTDTVFSFCTKILESRWLYFWWLYVISIYSTNYLLFVDYIWWQIWKSKMKTRNCSYTCLKLYKNSV